MMIKMIREQEDWLTKCLESESNHWDWIQAVHRVWIEYLQHERLVHLLVTLTLSVLLVPVAGLALWRPAALTAVLLALLTILVGFYVIHYYRLENTVQRWYGLDRELTRQIIQSRWPEKK